MMRVTFDAKHIPVADETPNWWIVRAGVCLRAKCFGMFWIPCALKTERCMDSLSFPMSLSQRFNLWSFLSFASSHLEIWILQRGVVSRLRFCHLQRHEKVGDQKAEWEAEILEAAKGCEQVIKSFGIFHISHGKSKGLPWKDFSRNDKGVTKQKWSTSVLFLEHCRCSIQHILDSEMRWSSRFRESEAAFVCKSVLKALHYLHSRCIVHRDVKSANILVSAGGGRILLCDFNLAIYLPPGKEEFLGGPAGTPGFMAPESFKEKATFSPESDMLLVLHWAIFLQVEKLGRLKYTLWQGFDLLTLVNLLVSATIPDYQWRIKNCGVLSSSMTFVPFCVITIHHSLQNLLSEVCSWSRAVPTLVWSSCLCASELVHDQMGHRDANLSFKALWQSSGQLAMANLLSKSF